MCDVMGVPILFDFRQGKKAREQESRLNALVECSVVGFVSVHGAESRVLAMRVTLRQPRRLFDVCSVQDGQ
jgi:primosomal replication protein N